MQFSLSESRALLARTPKVLDAWLRDIPAAWATCTEGGDSWSAYDVVGHLVHIEAVDWIPRIRVVLGDGEGRTFAPVNRTAMFEASKGKSLEQLLDEFATLRAQSLQQLDDLRLGESDFDRRAMHPALGEVTLRQLLSTWTAHDLGHLAQVARVMAKRYREDVGPWRQYLSLLEWKA